jgi:prephenate dehydrogenase
MAALSDCRILIAGLGLMGGSLAMALRGQCAEIAGCDADPATIAYARQHGIVDRAVEFDAALSFDVLVLATPVRVILAQLDHLIQSPTSTPAKRAVQPPTSNLQSPIILDLGSTKRDIVAAMERLPSHYDPIGGHPLCGKETSGITAAESSLFRGAVFALTPLSRTTPRALDAARQIVEAIGAQPLPIDAAQHDRILAVTSHLPYLLACTLVGAAGRLDDERAWRVAASGFRDTSRLAASNVTMMADILHSNRAEILNALSLARAELDRLSELIEAWDEDALRAMLESIAQRRSQLFKPALPALTGNGTRINADEHGAA